MEPRAGKPGARGYEAFVKCFERGLRVRPAGDVIALSPPLIVEPAQMARMVEILGDVIRATA
jgi:beta-alanine--pyruvate transaminase